MNVFTGLSPTLMAQIESGGAYINIHTGLFPAGEIRGQIAAVPEPATVGLLCAGLLALGTRVRRTRA